ncbi:hypothetical protein OAH08_03410 [Verrucomicrobia bacterium]|nr:hypothetical protein [Verrucomicrobiota bacterium]
MKIADLFSLFVLVTTYQDTDAVNDDQPYTVSMVTNTVSNCPLDAFIRAYS